MDTVLGALEAELSGLPVSASSSWKASVARALAVQVDESGSAAAARELRAVMSDLLAGVKPEKVNAIDELAAARKARRAQVS